MSLRRSAPAVLLSLALVACSGSDDAGTEGDATTTTGAVATTSEATTTTVAEVDPLAFAERGEYPVGVTTLQLADGTPVEVWYPAVEGTTGTETYDLRDYLPEAIRGLLTADVAAGATYEAGRDAEVAEGRFPLVLFSHGFSGVRVQSTFLTAHLASWGMIVAAPEHPSRNLTAVLTMQSNPDRSASVTDLTGALDLMVAADADATSPFAGHVDGERIGAVGHSAGGGTVLAASQVEPRIDGYVSMASGLLGGGAAGSTTTVPQLADVPSFFIAGSVDAVVSPETATRPAFEAAPAPSLLWIVEGVGHNGFDDFCTFGDGAGVIGLARANGLGALLESNAQLVRLGEDGCVEPALPVEDTFPIIQHSVTAWLLALLEGGTADLGPDLADAYDTPVVIEEK